MTRPIAIDPAASAVHIRDASERTIRAHAHRLLAGRRDAIRDLTPEQRRAELLALAEKVANCEVHADELAAAVLPHLTEHPDGFADLVDAVVVRQRFVGDPDEWLARRDLSLSAAVFETWDEATLAAVDECLDELCGVRA